MDAAFDRPFGVPVSESLCVSVGIGHGPAEIWPVRCLKPSSCPAEEVCMVVARPIAERRKWPRLPLAIPIFVRGHDGKGNEFLEFATALNVSAGGMLLAVRRVLPPSCDLRLEIPCAPSASESMDPPAARNLRARALRNTPAAGYYLLGLKFSRPLLRADADGTRRRKHSSSV